MGLDKTIRLEPFIKIPLQYEEYEEQIRTCGEHQDYQHNQYCGKCGKKIESVKKITKGFLNDFELMENEYFRSYIEGEQMYLYSNLNSKIEIDTNENVFTVISQDLIQSMIDEFSSKHKNDILILESKINAKVKIEFGFVYEVS